jgi:predicted transcriptional regulator
MADKIQPALSPAETEILRLLWRLESGTVQDVCKQLPPDRKITYATVQTLLRRLEQKGYVTHKSKGKAHVFIPTARQDEVIRRTVGDFVDRLFGGDPLPLMLHLAEKSKLDKKDANKLKKLIDKYESNEKGESK